MIQVNELRIGNWVIQDHDIMKIDSLYAHATPMCEPIPLTPEILEACGFNKKNILVIGEKGTCSLGLYLTYSAGSITMEYDYDDCGYASYNFMLNTNPIKHLHQLQNLYFSLTGKELEIKELPIR